MPLVLSPQPSQTQPTSPWCSMIPCHVCSVPLQLCQCVSLPMCTDTPSIRPTKQQTKTRATNDTLQTGTVQFWSITCTLIFFYKTQFLSIHQLMVAIAVCTRWVFRHVCFVFNGHANGTSDHHRVDHRGKRTFFNQCLVTVHPTCNISRGWHHTDSAVGLLKKKNTQEQQVRRGERNEQKC